MIQLEVFGETAMMAAVAESIERLDGVSRVRSVNAARPGHVLVAGLVRPRAVDPLLDELDRLGVPASEITLSSDRGRGPDGRRGGRDDAGLGGRAERGLAPCPPDRPLLRVDVDRRA